MKRILALLVVAAAAYGIYYFVFKKDDNKDPNTKETPLVLKKHSPAFNQQVDTVVSYYLAIKDAFVTADTATAKNYTRKFMAALDSLPIGELEKDSSVVLATVTATIEDVKSNASSLLAQTDVTEMRRDFSSLTGMMYPTFFTALSYEGEKLYLQHCPMAFEGGEGANWLSNNSEVVNPYLGNNHPKYKATMLHCGEVKDSIMVK